jgi:predicted nucleic acid-binding Zn ribbon protein
MIALRLGSFPYRVLVDVVVSSCVPFVDRGGHCFVCSFGITCRWCTGARRCPGIFLWIARAGRSAWVIVVVIVVVIVIVIVVVVTHGRRRGLVQHNVASSLEYILADSTSQVLDLIWSGYVEFIIEMI